MECGRGNSEFGMGKLGCGLRIADCELRID